MVEDIEFKTYLFISPREYKIYLLDIKNSKNLYYDEFKIEDNMKTSNLTYLNNFLKNNIFKIEKLIGRFVKNIYLVINSNKIINLCFCIKNKNYQNIIEKENLEKILTEAKDLFKKTYKYHKIMHIVINKFICDGKYYSKFDRNLNVGDLRLEIEFIVIPSELMSEIEGVLKNFQIEITKCLSENYIDNLLPLWHLEILY